jgi:hypothetical protein
LHVGRSCKFVECHDKLPAHGLIDGIYGLGSIQGNGCEAIYVGDEDIECYEDLWNGGQVAPGLRILDGLPE